MQSFRRRAARHVVALVLGVVLPLATAPEARAALGPGTHVNLTLESGGYARLYDLIVPASYDGATALPLVLDFHGYSSNKTQQRVASGFNAVAEREGVVVGYPQGLFGRATGDAARCEEELLALQCDGAPLPAKLGRTVRRKIGRARTLLRRSEQTTRAARADRLRAKALRQLDAISTRAADAAGATSPRLRISSDCRDTIEALVARRRALLGGCPSAAFLELSADLLSVPSPGVVDYWSRR
jgi:hypothetical protein